jgi:hypothetical protein
MTSLASLETSIVFELRRFFRQCLRSMYFRTAIFALLAAFVLAGISCKKSGTRAAAPPTVLPPDTVASVHWLGKRKLGYEATAFYFMRVWNLPPTAQLERQTINRLTTVPYRLLSGSSNLTNMSNAADVSLLPIIYDLEQEESYLEIRAATNVPSAAVLAIRLPDDGQAGRWFTNLPAVLQSLTGIRAVMDSENQSWSLQTSNTAIQLARVGDWTLVSAGPEKNPLTDEITTRIQRDGAPFISGGTDLWFEASLDLPRLARFFPSLEPRLKSPGHLNLAISGDGGNVITHGKLTFAQPFSAPLPPWRLPVNLMHEPLTSFTAVRGLQSSLTGWQPWRDLQIGPPPGQLFSWSLAGSAYQIYFAAPMPDAARQIAALTDHLFQNGNPWLAARGYISFDRAPDGNGVTWGNLPDIKPFIKSAPDGWLFAGLLPETNTLAAPPPAGLLNDVLNRTNLVYYDWEITGARLQPCLQLFQTARQILRQPQMPLDSAGLNCLAALIPRLGTSATIISRTGPAELTFVRRSTIGFTAPELLLLANWLE